LIVYVQPTSAGYEQDLIIQSRPRSGRGVHL